MKVKNIRLKGVWVPTQDAARISRISLDLLSVVPGEVPDKKARRLALLAAKKAVKEVRGG